MEQILHPFNLFSYKLNFTYKRNRAFDSLPGLLLSFIVYCLIGFLFYYFSKDFFFQTNPKLNYKEKMLSDDYEISLGDLLSSIELELSIEFNQTYSTDVSVSEGKNLINTNSVLAFDTKKFFNKNNYTIANFISTEIHIKEDIEKAKEGNYTAKSTNLKFLNFEVKNFEKNILTVFQKVDNKSKCESWIEKNEDAVKQNDSLLNSFEALLFDLAKLYKIQLSLIINEDLLKKENLSLKINTFNKKTTLRDYLIEVDWLRFGTEYNLIQKSEKYFDINSYTCYDFFFTVYEVIDNLGIIFSEPQASSFLKKTARDSKKYTYDASIGINFINLRINNVIVRYDRIYKKLQNVFADLGGIFSGILMIGNLLINSYDKKYFSYKAINFLYEKDNGKIKSIDISKSNFFEFESKQRASKGQDNNNVKIDNEQKLQNDFLSMNSNSNVNKIDEQINSQNAQKAVKKPCEAFFDSKRAFFSEDLDQVNKDLTLSFMKRTINQQSNDNSIAMYQKVISNPITNTINDDKGGLMDDKNIPLSIINNSVLSSIKKEKLKEKIDLLLKVNKLYKYKFNANNFFKESKNKEKEYIKLTKLDLIISSLICCDKGKKKNLLEKEQIFHIAEKKIDSYLNVLNYFDFFEDFEKLKNVILNDAQNLAFNFIRKRSQFDLSEPNYSEKIIKSLENFKANNNNLSRIDKSLLEKLSDEFIELMKLT